MSFNYKLFGSQNLPFGVQKLLEVLYDILALPEELYGILALPEELYEILALPVASLLEYTVAYKS